MKVSVVVPLYNKARHIKRAVDSVLAQTYQDFELIIVDDGSTDGSGDVVREFTDPRIRLVVQDNAGVSAARNRGIREAKCDLVAFLDADDEWLPFFLDTVVGLRARYPEAGICATAYRCLKAANSWRPAFIDCPDSPQGGLVRDYFHSAMGPQPVHSSAVMIPKHVLMEVGLFSEDLVKGEDLHMWGRIALRYAVAWSPECGTVYHLSADNRACLIIPVELDPHLAHVVPIEEFLQSGRKTFSPRHNVEEYCFSLRLNLTIACHLAGRRTWALYNLDRARNTSMFRRKRWLLRAALCFPPRGAKWVLAAKAQIRRIRPLRET
jgi:glycosyltransferase involved in cell wall biosynthesis